MCGETKPWQWKHDVVVRLTSPATNPSNSNATGGTFTLNAASVTVPLMQPLDMIEEVWLTEYQVLPSAGSPPTDMWRLSFLRSNLCDSTSCNAAGTGVPFMVFLGGPTHHTYNNPRRLSLTAKSGGLTSLAVDVTDELGQPVAFTSMTFFLTFVMRKRDWDASQALRNDANLVEWWRPNTNVGRFLV